MPTTSQLLTEMQARIRQHQAAQQQRRERRMERYAVALERRLDERFNQARRVVRRGDFGDSGPLAQAWQA